MIRLLVLPPRSCLCLYLCIRGRPGDGYSCSRRSDPLEEPRPFSGQHGHFAERPGWSGRACSPPACLLRALWGLTKAGVRVVILEPQPSEPLGSMCFHSSACKGQILLLKMITSLFSLYFDKH